MKKLLVFAAVVLGVGASATEASAAGGARPFCQDCGNNNQRGMFLFKYPLPAFQAAPWYLYWPYNAHFMTPSPLTGPYYAPPYTGLTQTCLGAPGHHCARQHARHNQARQRSHSHLA